MTTICRPIGKPFENIDFRISKFTRKNRSSGIRSASTEPRQYIVTTMPTNARVLATAVAKAEPNIPHSGKGPKPKMSVGVKIRSMTTDIAMNQSGVVESPVPRNAIIISVKVRVTGIATKIIRRYVRARSKALGGVPSRSSSSGANIQPPIATKTLIGIMLPNAVPMVFLTISSLRLPMA